jgi:CHAD domain-containing protein
LQNFLPFYATSNYDEIQLLETINSSMSLFKTESCIETLTYYDTFDWRLYHESLALVEGAGLYTLSRLNDGQRQASAQAGDKPAFVWDFPPGMLQNQLAPILQMRALLALAQVEKQAAAYRVLNEDQKTVVYLISEIMRLPQTDTESPLITRFRLKPVRGYDDQAQALALLLQEQGLVATGDDRAYTKIMQAARRAPGDYSSKIALQLEPAMRADEATKTVLRFLLLVMQQNEAGIKKDIDTEFLHDFRVAVRRTRSALSQVKRVFPAAVTERFKADFRAVGRFSNDLRDLDVYLLSETGYRALLPEILADDIGPLFTHLKRKRSQVLKQVRRDLESEQYLRIIQAWQAFLNEPSRDDPSAPNAGQPIINLAQARLYKIYRRIVKAGHQILENVADEKLHALRIECKKLRYLMEFFASLFPEDEIGQLVKQLKKLQDNLGDFNDLCVQEEYLLRAAAELPAAKAESQEALLAIGGLISRLDQERQVVKADFAKTFTNFASPENQAHFKRLFKPQKKVAAR